MAVNTLSSWAFVLAGLSLLLSVFHGVRTRRGFSEAAKTNMYILAKVRLTLPTGNPLNTEVAYLLLRGSIHRRMNLVAAVQSHFSISTICRIRADLMPYLPICEDDVELLPVIDVTEL